jgi:hypothetical protein
MGEKPYADSQRVVICKPGREPSPETKPCLSLTLDLTVEK